MFFETQCINKINNKIIKLQKMNIKKNKINKSNKVKITIKNIKNKSKNYTT